MAKLFGFSIDDSQNKAPSVVSPVPPSNEDGVDYYIQSGFYGQYVDIEGVFKTEYDLVRRYREMALHPEADGAIEDVVNEAIVSDLYDSPIEIEVRKVTSGPLVSSEDSGDGTTLVINTQHPNYEELRKLMVL